jgi:hypothetical protein
MTRHYDRVADSGGDRAASTICSGLIGVALNSAPKGARASPTALAIAAGGATAPLVLRQRADQQLALRIVGDIVERTAKPPSSSAHTLRERDLGRLVCEIRLDVCRQPTERAAHHSWDRGLINTRGPAPEAGHVRLKVPALHSIAEFSQPLILIGGGKNEAHQCVEMITEIFARNFALRAEVPNPRLAGYLGAAWTLLVPLTPPVGPCGLLPNNARNLVGVERVAGKPQRSKHLAGAFRVRHRCCRVFAMLIRNRPVIIYDHAVRSAKIARGLNFMNRPSELPVLDAEPIADGSSSTKI